MPCDYTGWFGKKNGVEGARPTDIFFQITMQYLPLHCAINTGRAKNSWYKNVTDRMDTEVITEFQEYIIGKVW